MGKKKIARSRTTANVSVTAFCQKMAVGVGNLRGTPGVSIVLMTAEAKPDVAYMVETREELDTVIRRLERAGRMAFGR